MQLLSFRELFASIITESKHLEPRETLFRQGDPATHIFMVQEGCIRLVRYTVEGSSVCVHTAHPGESFAEAALFSDIYHCDAEALLPSIIHCYPKDRMFSILHEHPDKADHFIALLAHHVRSLCALLEVRSIRSAHERILQFLLLHADPQNLEVERVGTYKNMAHELGLAHETFYRALAELEKTGKIKRTGTAIKIVLNPRLYD
jgi:CRP-like cAMP-binding protein